MNTTHPPSYENTLLKRIDHVALVVPDLDEAIALYARHFGVAFDWRVHNEEAGFGVAAFYLGDFHIELLCPTRADSDISKFLEKRGSGIHHIAFEVEDIQKSVSKLRIEGLSPINDTPRMGTGGSRIIFLHPKAFMGAMIELIELPPQETNNPS